MKDDFKVLEVPPSTDRNMWTYATIGMSSIEEENPVELHIFSSKQDESLVELLTAIAHYHISGHKLDLNHPSGAHLAKRNVRWFMLIGGIEAFAMRL